MNFSGQRFHLGELHVSRKGRFALSLFLGFVGVGLLAAALAAIVHPELLKPDQVVQVVSSPALAESSEAAATAPKETPFRAQPLPTPPVQTARASLPIPPVAPILATPEKVNTDFLVADSHASLEVIAQFHESEEQRLAEIIEQEERERKAAEQAALLAKQKAAEQEAKRQQEAAARAVAALAEQNRRAQEQAIAARETQARRAEQQALAAQQQALAAQQQALANKDAAARRAQEQALAAQNAAARRAQEQSLAANQEQARRAAAQAEAERKAAARTAAESRRVASRAAIQKTSTPSYPTSARRSGQQGTARIQVTVTTKGKVSSPRLIASSGHSSLDSSALKAVKKYRFAPARNGLGHPIQDQVVIPITFQLR